MDDLDLELAHAEETGLRARKRAATREALSLAALRLALDRGPENVRVDDIAAAAGVSTRTYNNYFSSREEAICAVGIARAHRISDALRARPVDEPLAEAITEAMVGEYVGGDRTEPDKAMIRLITSSPALRGEFLKTAAAIEAPLAQAIAERTGTDPDRDLFPPVMAAAVCSAARVATQQWLRPASSAPFASILREALAQVTPAAAAFDKEPAC